MKKRTLEFLMALILLVSAYVVSQQGAAVVETVRAEEHYTVVLDAGHGGKDPGKVGVNEALEKDLNLSIAEKLKEGLEAEGIEVIMIRESDQGLYDEDASNKKVQDLQRRVALINEKEPDLAVSIHQNSYEDSSVKGPQVFYFSQSERGEKLASLIQECLNTGMSVERPRSIKANSNYYLLKNSEPPVIIVECGFLSNPQEAAELMEASYQQKLAGCIKEGIIAYLEDNNL